MSNLTLQLAHKFSISCAYEWILGLLQTCEYYLQSSCSIKYQELKKRYTIQY